MLEPLRIEADDFAPQVIFDKENNIFELSGKSLPEDAEKFFSPLINWIKKYSETPNDFTRFVLNLSYFNSASVRKIVDLLIELEKISNTDKKIKVVWYYDETDDMMHDVGQDFKNVLNIPFELIPYQPD